MMTRERWRRVWLAGLGLMMCSASTYVLLTGAQRRALQWFYLAWIIALVCAQLWALNRQRALLPKSTNCVKCGTPVSVIASSRPLCVQCMPEPHWSPSPTTREEYEPTAIDPRLVWAFGGPLDGVRVAVPTTRERWVGVPTWDGSICGCGCGRPVFAQAIYERIGDVLVHVSAEDYAKQQAEG